MDVFLQTAVTILLCLLGSGGMWTYLDHRRQARESRAQQETAEQKAERDIVKALARVELVRVCLAYIAIGSITVEEADALTELYSPYETLGGNGNGKRLYEQAMILPKRTGRISERKEG